MSDTAELRTGDLSPVAAADAPEPDSGSELIGVTLNDTYVVERLLGEGGMGRVYLARHTRIAQKRVAVKVLHPEYAQNPQVRARFQREAEAAAAIAHPNVLSVFDVDVTPGGMPYLVCEYLEGIDLAELLKRQERLSIEAAIAVTRQLCRGLGAAHERGIIHRDLKPPNVFLVGDFEAGPPERLFAKVLDFGLSRFETAQGETDLTKTGLIMGTPSYMSPEQAHGRRVDQRADVYGVGAILYKALTGRAPFNEGSPRATVLAVMSAEPPRPRSLEPSLPVELELVIERAMAKDPDQRYPDMLAFERALDTIRGAGVPAAIHSMPAPDRRSKHFARGPEHLALAAGGGSVRGRLVLVAVSAVLLGMAAALSAVPGIELATSHSFNRAELELVLLAVIASAISPALLWVLRVRRRVWDSSSRVLVAHAELRAAVVTALTTYGVLLLALQVIDNFVVHLLARPALQAGLSEWTGWSLVLPVIALSSGVTARWQTKIALRAAPGWRRGLAVWSVRALAVGVAGALLYGGLLWRARTGLD